MDKTTIMMTSILLSCFKRPHLLKLGLFSIRKNKPTIDYEILVLNDGIPDETESVCNGFKDLNIRYIFTGQRNLNGIKKRVSGFTMNIGIKQALGDIILFSCPEIFQLNECIDIVVEKLIENPMCMVIPDYMYFDQKKILTDKLIDDPNTTIDYNLLSDDIYYNKAHVQMPYLMALFKHHLLEIGGYDEDFIGYAGEDNDLVDRLKLKGLTHLRTKAKIIHLYHEGTGNGYTHYDNPDWVYNFNLLKERKGILIRNVGKNWGKIDEI